MIPSSRPKLSDLYTLSQSKLFENHTLHSQACFTATHTLPIFPIYGRTPPPHPPARPREKSITMMMSTVRISECSSLRVKYKRFYNLKNILPCKKMRLLKGILIRMKTCSMLSRLRRLCESENYTIKVIP